MIRIKNNGPELVETDYWDSEHARQGYFFLSINAGTARLLIPDNQRSTFDDVHHVEEVVISQGPWEQNPAIELVQLLWEDRSDNPFMIMIIPDMMDRSLDGTAKSFPLVAWTRAGRLQQWPARFRRVRSVPQLD